MKTISIILCTYNRAISLRSTLSALASQDIPAGADCEIIVVDNNSQDNTQSVVAEASKNSPIPIVYSFEKKQGLSWARNHGVEIAQGEFVLFTDDDIVPDKNWIQSVLTAFRVYDADVVSGKILPMWQGKPEGWMMDTKYWGQLALLDRGDKDIVVKAYDANIMYGANMAYRRTSLMSIGNFNPRLGVKGSTRGVGEDSEMLERFLRAGKRVVYSPQAVVHHKIAEDRLTLSFYRNWKYHQGRSAIVRKEHTLKKLPLWLVREVLQHGLLIIVFALTLKRDQRIHHELLFWNQLGQVSAILETIKPKQIGAAA